MEHKEVLQNLQKAYVEAGSQIVYAPTFGGNRYSLGLHGLQDKLVEMNHALVNISREAVGHQVYDASVQIPLGIPAAIRLEPVAPSNTTNLF